MKNPGKIFLLIFPAVYLVLGYHFNHLIGGLSLRNVDPEYIFLTNGLYMSTGDLNVSHIDNPGTPLQMIVALVCRMVYFFRPHEVPYLEDVLRNSDLYLDMVNHAVISITAVLIYTGGVMVLRLTSFLPYAFLVQTAPFFSQITYDIAGRVTPELLISIPVIFLTVLLIKVSREDKRKFDIQTILAFCIISGFGLSVKLTYLPLLITPVLVIPGYKDKLRFFLFTLISFLVFAIPVVFDLVSFTRWAFALFLGSGQYGGGESAVVDPEVFRRNFWYFRQTHLFLVVVWTLSLMVWLAYLLRGRGKKNRRLFYSLGGVLLTLLLQVVMVSKHYEYRYLVPGLALFPAMVILSFMMMKEMICFRGIRYVTAGLILAGFAVMVPRHVESARARAAKISVEITAKMQTKHFIETLEEEAILLLTPEGYGSPFHAFSMMVSYSWSGKAGSLLLPVYRKIYPDTYQYFSWEGRPRSWSKSYEPPANGTALKPVYFYIAEYTPELYDVSLKAMWPGYDPARAEAELLFWNRATGERVYRLWPEGRNG